MVAWVTLRTYSVPSMESLPVSRTAGNIQSFLLSPFNFYKEDPSLNSRDALDLETPGLATEYHINNHGTTKAFMCSVEYEVTDEKSLIKNETITVYNKMFEDDIH